MSTTPQKVQHPIIEQIRGSGLSYLSSEALAELYDAIDEIERLSLPGMLIEAGCAAGGSTIVMAAAKRQERRFCVYDVFGMIPPPSEADGEDVHARYSVIAAGKSKGIRGRTYYGYEPDLYASVVASLDAYGLEPSENNISTIKGLYEETLHIRTPVALAHIDCDWYESVLICLERVVPMLTAGGVLIIDDYDQWSGCRKAVDDYFAEKQDQYAFHRRSRLHIIRRRKQPS